MNIGIIFGGKSAEHSVSCVSAHSVYSNIDTEKYNPVLIGITKDGKFRYYDSDIKHLLDATWEDYCNTSAKVDLLGTNGQVGIISDDFSIQLDCIIPILHGPFGEDGKLQGILEYSNIAYVGCGVLSSSVCMDKATTKEVLNSKKIPQTKFILHEKNDSMDSLKEKIKDFKYPIFIKPSNMGSSIGIEKINSVDDLESAINEALKYDGRILIEEGLNAREIEVAVLETVDGIIVSEPGELIVQEDFYDFETKYVKGNTLFEIPAKLSDETRNHIKEIAYEVFKILNCRGISRIDFFVEKDTGKIFLNEVNTMPGFTEISMYPKLLINEGIKYSDIIDKLILFAMNGYGKEK